MDQPVAVQPFEIAGEIVQPGERRTIAIPGAANQLHCRPR